MFILSSDCSPYSGRVRFLSAIALGSHRWISAIIVAWFSASGWSTDSSAAVPKQGGCFQILVSCRPTALSAELRRSTNKSDIMCLSQLLRLSVRCWRFSRFHKQRTSWWKSTKDFILLYRCGIAYKRRDSVRYSRLHEDPHPCSLVVCRIPKDNIPTWEPSVPFRQADHNWENGGHYQILRTCYDRDILGYSTGHGRKSSGGALS